MATIRITNGASTSIPRYELMEPIVEVFRRTGKTVPVFSDKHFSYSVVQGQTDVRVVARVELSRDGGLVDSADPALASLEIPYGAEIEKR